VLRNYTEACRVEVEGFDSRAPSERFPEAMHRIIAIGINGDCLRRRDRPGKDVIESLRVRLFGLLRVLDPTWRESARIARSRGRRPASQQTPNAWMSWPLRRKQAPHGQ
jgi:hypothetical protein